MSSYKTPIRIHVNSTRKVNDKISKYRLPFKKDQPVVEKKISISTNGKDDYYVSAESLRNREESRVSTVVGVSPDKNENKKQE